MLSESMYMGNPARHRARRFCACFLAALFLCPSIGRTQVNGSGLGTQVNFDSPTSTHNISGGTRAGANLFHSFFQFSVAPGETANFSNPGGSITGINNILGRVTGNQTSQIFGLIRSSEFSGANLFLINPAGWVFGTGAALDVGGSFHVSTANYIRMGDAQFNLSVGEADVLLMSAPPVAFGFLGSPVGTITVDGATLAVPEGKTLSLVGGDIPITSSTLSAPSGRIGIAAVASAGEVAVADLALTGFSSLGTVTISGDANAGLFSVLDTSGIPTFDGFGNVNGGGPGGQVVIRGGQLVVIDSLLLTGGHGDLSGGVPMIDVAVSGSVQLTNSLLDVSGKPVFDADGFTLIGGAGGTVAINADSLTANGSTLLAATNGSSNGATLGIDISVANEFNLIGGGLGTFANGAGDGGGIRVRAGTMRMQEFAGLITSTTGAGRGGNIDIQAASVIMDLFSIGSDTAGSGVGGDVTISTSSAGSLVMSNGTISTVTHVDGPGGKLLLSSPSITLDAGALVLSQANGTAAGGDLQVQAGDLAITGGALIKSDSGGGPGGNIFVNATGSALISGASSGILSGGSGVLDGVPAGNISLSARQLTITAGGTVQNGTINDVAGNIVVSATDSIVISDGGQILSQAFQTDVGDLTISVPSGSLLMDRGLIQASTINAGNAGNVNVNVATLSLTNGAQIVSNAASFADGRGGNVTINAASSVSIAGATSGTPLFGLESSSGLFSVASLSPDAAARGGGNIIVTTPLLTISGGGKVAASTPATGQAGGISLNGTNTLTLTGGSLVTAATSGAGKGGDIALTGNHIDILGGARVTAEASSTGNAGTVTINATGANSLTISGAGSVVSTSTSGDGHGGDVNLVSAGDINISNGGIVSADSLAAGRTGTINVTAGDSIIMDHGTISTRAVTSDGGNIKLTAPNVIQLEGSTITTSVESGVGGGGNISIDPQFVLVNNSSIIANAFGGPGGNIIIVANNFLASANSVIDASSALSTPGVIEIRSPENNVESSIAQLPAAFLDASALLRGLCTARRTGAPSSFVVAGRGGVPVDADGYLPSFGTDLGAAMAGIDDPALAGTGRTSEAHLPLSLLLANNLDCAR